MNDRPSHCQRCGAEAQYGAEVSAGGRRFWLCLGCDGRLLAWLKPVPVVSVYAKGAADAR